MGGAGGDLELGSRFERDGHRDGLGGGLDAVGEAEQVPVDEHALVLRAVARELLKEGADAVLAREGDGRTRAVDEDALELEADLLARGVLVAALEHADERLEVLAERAGEGGYGR